jgi:integrase
MTVFFEKLKSVYESVYKMKKYTDPKIYHGGKDFDLSKRWYIYYSYLNPDTDKMTMQTPVALSLNKQYKTVSERLKHFKILRESMIKILKDGYSPYESNIEEEMYTAESCLDYTLSLKKSTLAETSYLDYENKTAMFKQYLKSHGYLKQNIKSINKRLINNYLDYLLTKENSSPANRNNHRSVLSALFTVLEKKDYIERNFIPDIEKLEAKPKRNKTYEIDKANEILAYLEDNEPTLALLMKFVSYNFLRPIEACRLQVKDLELKSFPKVLKVKAKNKLVKTKIIPEIMLDELNKLDLSNSNSYLITYQGIAETETSDRERRDYFTKKFKTIKKKFDLDKDYTLYSFRHTFITKLYRELRKNNGQHATYDKLMLITGHSSLDSLKKYLRDIDVELPDDYSEFLK